MRLFRSIINGAVWGLIGAIITAVYTIGVLLLTWEFSKSLLAWAPGKTTLPLTFSEYFLASSPLPEILVLFLVLIFLAIGALRFWMEWIEERRRLPVS